MNTDVMPTTPSAKHGYGPGSTLAEDALSVEWRGVCWMNPPYSRCREFIEKASREARYGRATTVCLVPSRTDTRWWHEFVWDEREMAPYKGVDVQFLRGRVKFGDGKNSAPFPSVVVVFNRGVVA